MGIFTSEDDIFEEFECEKPEDEEAINLMSSVDDNDGQCIRLLSFCKKHKHPTNKCQRTNENLKLLDHCASNYVPPPNPSGCARSGRLGGVNNDPSRAHFATKCTHGSHQRAFHIFV